MSGALISRIFHRHDVAWPKHAVRNYSQRSLRPTCYQQLRLVDGQPTRGAQHRRERGAKTRMASLRTVRQHLPGPPLDRPPPCTRNCLRRDESQIGQPREVVSRRQTGRAGLQVYARAEVKRLDVAGDARACDGGKAPRPGIRKRPGHERPAAIFGRDPAFGSQVVVSGDDRIAIDAQRMSQPSRAGHRFAGTKPAPSNIARDGTRDLRKDWEARLGIDGNREVPSSHVTLFSSPPCGLIRN